MGPDGEPFAVASMVAPLRAPFDEVLGNGKEQLLIDIDRLVMHDAVLNTAIVWKHVWHKVSKLD